MKPDWKDAPEWAQCLAMDECGVWWWYENEPVENHESWDSCGGRIKWAGGDSNFWTESLERRPAWPTS